ncbi:MAG: hypothetical protein WC498_04130 [Candidatus Saccharimonadales bacterium]
MKKPNPKPKKHTKNNKKRVFLTILVVLVAFVGALSIRAYVHNVQTNKQFAADKIRFANTEKDMADAYNAIVKAVGQPYDANVTKICAYGALKYARGPLGCMITYGFAYSVNDRPASKVNGTVVNDVLANDFGLGNGTISYGISEFDQQSGQYFEDFDNAHGLGCTLNHETYTANEYNSYGKQSSGLKSMATTSMSTFMFECEKNTPRAVYYINKSTE